MRAFRTSLVIGLMLLLIPASANAVTLFSASMDGAQEVPPIATLAGGSFSGALAGEPGAWEFMYIGSYSNLSSDVVAGHLFQAPYGSTGPAVYALENLSGGASGTFSGLWNPTDTQANQLLAGDIYVNILSDPYSDGEIRGQIYVVPEPTSLSLLGVAGLTALCRRRR